MTMTTIDTVAGNALGVVSGCAVLMIDTSASVEVLYSNAHKSAMKELEKAASDLGASAIVGVHTAVAALGAGRSIITVTGTAVSGAAVQAVAAAPAAAATVTATATATAAAPAADDSEKAVEAMLSAEAEAAVSAASQEAPAEEEEAEAAVNSALETNLINLISKHPEGMDGVGISKKIPRIYYSPSEVSASLKHLVDTGKLVKDEFGVFKLG